MALFTFYLGAEDHAGALLRRPIPLLRCREQLRPVTLGLLLGVVGQVDMGQRVGGGGVGVLAASKVLAAALPRYLAPITTNGVQRLKAADDKQGSGGDKARRPPPTARARQPRQALQAGRAGCRWKSPHATPPASTEPVRRLNAPWWGVSRRGRPGPHHGAFGRLSTLSDVLSSQGKSASNPLALLLMRLTAASALHSYSLIVAFSLGL